MNKILTIVVGLLAGLLAGIPLGGRFMPVVPSGAEGQNRQPAAAAPAIQSYSAVPNAIGAEDVSGPYDVVQGWPKDLASLPGHEKWTWGGARGIFAESPNRVYLLQGGELPNLKRPQTRLLPEIGPNVQFPIGGVPWRNANAAAPPGAGAPEKDRRKEMSRCGARRRRIASSASTRAGKIPSSSWTRKATS